jgi:hypothetical protein
MAVTINKKTMAMIILAAFIFLALTSAAIQAEKIAFVRENNIWIANLDGGTQKQLTFSGKMKDPANFFPNLALSPDGQRIAYSDMKDIYLLSTSGGEPVKLNLPGMKSADHPFFSSDGSKLLFLGKMNTRAGAAKNKASELETNSISMVELDSGKVKNIIVAPDKSEDFPPYNLPSLSPSGRLFAIQDGATDYSGGFGILNETGKLFFHFPPGAADETPYWRPLFSADGKKILCFSPATNSKGSDIIYLVDIDSGTKKRVAEGLWPTFVDNGRAIVFERWNVHSIERDKSSKSDLWLLELREGAQPKKIIANAASPAGQTLRKDQAREPDLNSQVGPEAVWDLPSHLYGSFTGCDEDLECLMPVMKQGGASPQAMAFTRMMKDNCYLEKFKEMGKVDLAQVFYPRRANTNWAYFLVNGSPPLISTENVENFSINITKDPLYASWSKRYSNLSIYDPAVFQQMQTLPDGGQSFIFAYALIEGPRAGKKAGWVLVAFDFDGQGRFLQTRLVRLAQEIPRNSR